MLTVSMAPCPSIQHMCMCCGCSMAGILSGNKARLPNGKSLVGFAVGWLSSFGALIAVYARACRLVLTCGRACLQPKQYQWRWQQREGQWCSRLLRLALALAVTKEARREMAILGFHSEKHRMALALFGGSVGAVSYTHLTLPTILLV